MLEEKLNPSPLDAEGAKRLGEGSEDVELTDEELAGGGLEVHQEISPHLMAGWKDRYPPSI